MNIGQTITVDLQMCQFSIDVTFSLSTPTTPPCKPLDQYPSIIAHKVVPMAFHTVGAHKLNVLLVLANKVAMHPRSNDEVVVGVG